MKYLFSFLLLGLFLLPQSPVFTQDSLIILTEINGSGNKNLPIPVNQTATVDVNSSIGLRLDLAQIETAILKFQGISSEDSRLEKLENLNALLKREVDITNYINSGFKSKGDSLEKQLSYFEGLYKRQNRLLRDLRSVNPDLFRELSGEEPSRAYLNFDGSYVEFVLFFLNQKADELRKEILASLGLAEGDSSLQVYFRLGAFLRNKDGGRPVHIENFDNYNSENYQEVSRFGSPISEDEQQALKENAKLNNELGGGISQTVNNFKGVIQGYKQELFAFRKQFQNLESTYESNLQSLRASPKTLPAADVLMDNSLGLNLIEALYSTLFSQYGELSRLFSPDMPKNEKIDETLTILETTILEGYNKFDHAVNQYNQGNEKSGKDELSLVQAEYKNYVGSAQKNVLDIKAFIQRVRNMIRPFRKAYLENEEFAEEVGRFTIGKIPPTGLIELNYIGRVAPGDEILIKASLERGRDRDNRNFEEKPLFRQVLKLQRIKPYIRMSGSIIMANPYTRSDIPAIDLENNFQFAPTYGIILKWGSRKNTFYNKFVNLGVGFAFSSPDFNTDGTPEFGAGIMLTAFRDILSVGWGRNFGLDAPYTFIGFNIPFSIGGLPSDNSGRFEN